MNFRDYWFGLPVPDRPGFAERCGSSVGYLTSVAGGFKKLGEGMAIRVERESGGAVTVEELLPDVDWAVIRGKPAATEAAAS